MSELVKDCLLDHSLLGVGICGCRNVFEGDSLLYISSKVLDQVHVYIGGDQGIRDLCDHRIERFLVQVRLSHEISHGGADAPAEVLENHDGW